MAVYRIFPENDTFIYTEEIICNAGLDEINEIGGYPIAGIGQTSRLLIKFSDTDIQSTVNDKINGNDFSASIHLYLASAYELPHSYSLECYPVAESWINGVGKYGDIPVDKSGVSWRYRDNGESAKTSWTVPEFFTTGSLIANSTSSYNTTYPGGGVWLTGSGGINLETSQTFILTKDHDVEIDATNATLLHFSSSIVNNGFILKLTDDLEFNTTSSIRLKYYSADTNTIYPPYLEFKWDDSVYETGSLSVLNTSETFINLTNNTGRYVDEGKQRFRIKARPKYPTRTFTTSSAYTINFALPVTSYWGLRDEFTEEMIIPFDTDYTKISCDSTGPFFDIYMDGLQPERFYRVLVKTEIDGSTVIVDNRDTFKVVRNG
jgi:hypothetical protein